MDLRGYGASDKPPRGYSTYTGAEDAATVIRSLGEDDAIVVGQGLGGVIAWSMPYLQPDVVRAVGSLSMPHPRVMRRASVRKRRQRQASRYVVELQRPFVPEREMTKDHAYVGEMLSAWASPFGDYPTPEDVERYGNAMALPFVAHSAAEHYRWFGRSQLRQDGPLFNRRIRGPIAQPVLHLQGTEDGCVLADCTTGSSDYVTGPYTFQLVDGAGHFLTEEAPDRVSAAIVDWLDTVDA
jgi:pimeloyl-ACP methyl ester carboxylesterase